MSLLVPLELLNAPWLEHSHNDSDIRLLGYAREAPGSELREIAENRLQRRRQMRDEWDSIMMSLGLSIDGINWCSNPLLDFPITEQLLSLSRWVSHTQASKHMLYEMNNNLESFTLPANKYLPLIAEAAKIDNTLIDRFKKMIEQSSNVFPPMPSDDPPPLPIFGKCQKKN